MPEPQRPIGATDVSSPDAGVVGFPNCPEVPGNSRIKMGGLPNHISKIKGLAHNLIGYRYTIPQETNENSLADSIA